MKYLFEDKESLERYVNDKLKKQAKKHKRDLALLEKKLKESFEISTELALIKERTKIFKHLENDKELQDGTYYAKLLKSIRRYNQFLVEKKE